MLTNLPRRKEPPGAKTFYTSEGYSSNEADDIGYDA